MARGKMKGGDLFEDAALIGVGAYAARNPNTPGMGIVANVGKFFLYAMIAVVLFFVILVLYAIFFGKRVPAPATTATGTTAPPVTTPPPAREHLTMCNPGETPETKGGEPGCRTGSGNWYAH